MSNLFLNRLLMTTIALKCITTTIYEEAKRRRRKERQVFRNTCLSFPPRGLASCLLAPFDGPSGASKQLARSLITYAPELSALLTKSRIETTGIGAVQFNRKRWERAFRVPANGL